MFPILLTPHTFLADPLPLMQAYALPLLTQCAVVRVGPGSRWGQSSGTGQAPSGGHASHAPVRPTIPCAWGLGADGPGSRWTQSRGTEQGPARCMALVQACSSSHVSHRFALP